MPISVFGPGDRRVQVEATIDTGFNGYLTLPPAVVSGLELSFVGTTLATLGDGQRASLDLFLGAVAWHGDPLDVLVLQAEGGALLGMAALEGSRLTVDVTGGGNVTIQPL